MLKAGFASHQEDERVETNRVDWTTERSFRDASSPCRISMHHSVFIAIQVMIRNILVAGVVERTRAGLSRAQALVKLTYTFGTGLCGLAFRIGT